MQTKAQVESDQPKPGRGPIIGGVIAATLIAIGATVLFQTSGETIDPVEIATEFLRARGSRNIEEAQSYLDESVFLDWGPGQTYDTLEAGWAWEDAFGIVSTGQECQLQSGSEERIAVVHCSFLVQTAVAEAMGHEPGMDCVDFTIENGLITEGPLGAPGPGCVYSYWEPTFVPFYAWMRDAHPGSDPDYMYSDRTSPEGIELWRRYTVEFLAVHTG